MTATQDIYLELDGLEIEACVTARMVRSDYGVDRSPVWHEAEDIDIDTVTVDGDEYTVKELEGKFGKDMADRIIAAAAAKAVNGEWGDEDDWYDGPDTWDDD